MLIFTKNAVIGKNGCKGFASVPTHDNDVYVKPGVSHPMLREPYYELKNADYGDSYYDCKNMKSFAVEISLDPAFDGATEADNLYLLNIGDEYYAESSIKKCLKI